MPRKQRVLVHHIGSLGDTIVTMPGLRMVRRKYGDTAVITLLSNLAPAEIVKSSDVLEGSGLVDDYLEYRLDSGKLPMLKSIAKLWLMLVARRFDTVVYLMESERTAKNVKRDESFYKLCGIRERLGFEAFPREYLFPRDANGFPGRVTHEAVRRAQRIGKYGLGPVTESDFDEPFLVAPDMDRSAAVAWLKLKRQAPDKVLVGFCPGTKMPSKRWPLERFAEIGKRLVEDGRFEIVIVGGPADKAAGNALIEEWGVGLNAAGAFSVMGSAALLHQCKFVVSVDSGPMHLAAVGGVPCVAIFGSLDYPGRFSPLGRHHVVLRHGDLPCAACRLTDCPVPGHPCMTGITVDEVWQGVRKVCDVIGEPIAK
jgi:heptosyltransferase-3